MKLATMTFPLATGLDLSKETTLGPDGLRWAINVDYAVDGRVEGRPSRTAPLDFELADPLYSLWGSSADYLPPAAFNTLSLTQCGLVPIIAGGQEVPGLATQGKLFVKHDDTWVDHGAFGCISQSTVGMLRQTVAGSVGAVTSDFGIWARPSATQATLALLDADGNVERLIPGGTNRHKFNGTGARCGTTTAIVTVDNANKLWMTYRTNGGDTLTEVQLAADAKTPTNESMRPVICCDQDQTQFFVAYATTTANTVKAMQVSITGTVGAVRTESGFTNLYGLYVCNSEAAAGYVALAVTDDDGITVHFLDSTDMTVKAASITYQNTTGGGSNPGRQCVVGFGTDDQNGVVAFGMTSYRSATYADIMTLGAMVPSGTYYIWRTYDGGIKTNNAYIRWLLVHQPVVVAGRWYITIAAGTGDTNTTTWLSLDLSDWFLGGIGTGPLNCPTIVAQGDAWSTYSFSGPMGAIVTADGTGWDFPTTQFSEFAVKERTKDITGRDAITVINRLRQSGTRAATVGSQTLLSGSVPRLLPGTGVCRELGYPFLGGTPGCDIADNSSGVGNLTDGDYAVAICWTWRDETGAVHRSAPSPTLTLTDAGAALITNPGTDSILVAATNPWITEKFDTNYGPNTPQIEVYIAGPNPADGDPLYLTTVVTPDYSAACTFITLNDLPDATQRSLGSSTNVLPGYPVRGDGGIATLGKRVYMASASTVYASSYTAPDVGPVFPNQDTHNIRVPAGAGRVVSLESFDDKLVVLCEKGVYLIQDGGPDDIGLGADFAPPLPISSLGVAGPRSSCATDQGIVFSTKLDSTDPSRGGLWLIDRQWVISNRQFLGRPVAPHLADATWIPEVCYSPTRQQLYCTTPYGDAPGSTGILVFDMRVGKWAVWPYETAVSATLFDVLGQSPPQGAITPGDPGPLQSITTVGGLLWALGDEPSCYSGAPGTDLDAGGTYYMFVQTHSLPSNGKDTLGWGRIRSMSVQGAAGQGNHQMTMTVLLDNDEDVSIIHAPTDYYDYTTTTQVTTWPLDRKLPEWRLPQQKCSTIQCAIYAIPATARWAAIRLDALPLEGRAPARNRQ